MTQNKQNDDPVRSEIFETANKKATEDLEGFEKATETLKKRTTRKKTTRRKTSSKKEPILSTEDRDKIRDELREEIKKQLLDEINDERSKQKLIQEQQIQEEDAALKTYSEKMKESPHPWFNFSGRGPITDEGFKIEMEWNAAFIDVLKKQRIVGANEDQMINNWLTLFLHQFVNNEEGEEGEEISEYE